jgi:large subunit ribosomal protein L9
MDAPELVRASASCPALEKDSTKESIMAKNVELLLVESVENVGIVGDVVKVRTGFARNFLLPRALATVPSDELVQKLQAKRAEAIKAASELRASRAATISKLTGYELTIQRSCNDQGILYGGVTQQEIATALVAAGYAVRPRDVRLSGAIKRVDDYVVHIKYETELETDIKLHVKADRVLAKDEKPDLDFDNEGNLITKRSGEEGGRGGEGKGEDRAEKKGEGKADAGDKPSKAEKKDAKPAAPAAEDAPKKATRKPREDAKKPAKG